MADTKQCPNGCGKMIIRSTGITLASYPPVYPQEWWCGGCGHRESAPSKRGRTTEEIEMERWKKANE